VREIKIINGIIKEINISSGHYKPTFDLNKQLIDVLNEKGLKIDYNILLNEY
jgi:hypothetical protein